MPENYAALQHRVELYFDETIHTYQPSKHSMSCARCFLFEEHPLHGEDLDVGTGSETQAKRQA